MKKQLLIFILLLTPACVSNLGKNSNVKPTPVASKSAVLLTPTFTPVASPFPSNYEITSPTPTPSPFIPPKVTCLSFYIKPTPTPVSGAPDIAGDFAPHFVPIIGVVYDKDKKPVPDVTVRMEVISEFYTDMCTLEEVITDSDGKYRIPDSIYGIKVKLTLHKDGYKDVSRTESEPPDNLFSIIDFGGDNPKDSSYFLEKI